MQVRTIVGNSLPSLRTALSGIGEGGFVPRLAIVFSSVEFDCVEVGRAFGERDIQVFGATSAGGIMATQGSDDSVLELSVVALLLDLPTDAFRVKRLDSPDGAAIGRWAVEAYKDPALLVMGSGLRTDGEILVHALQAAAGKPLPLYGGLAGDDLKFSETFVFDEKGASNEGVIALALDQSRVHVKGVAASGWEAVGGEKTVTSSAGNVVQTIDGSPALDVYKEYLGIASDTDIIIPEYPLQIVKDGYRVMRAALLSDPETRALIYAGSVPEGARVRFSTAPGLEITEVAVTHMHSLHELDPDAEALVMFSCKGRHMALGPLAEDEVSEMQKIWGVPMVGLFAYGEIGNGFGEPCDFHNETCVLVSLREG